MNRRRRRILNALLAAVALPLEAKENETVVLVLFSLPGCHYCETVREMHLPPVRSDERWRDRLEIIEVDISSSAPLTRFPGRSEKAFAATHGVRIAPTVMAFDNDGRPLGRPIVGAKIPDFYGYYLADLLEAAFAAQGLR